MNFKNLKRSILILVGLTIWIASKGQTVCDSCIQVKPQTFDFLIRQNVLAKQYQLDNRLLLSEQSNLKQQLVSKDSIIGLKDHISNIDSQQIQLLNLNIKDLDSQLKKRDRKIIGLKIGVLAVGISGLASTIYFLVN